MSAVMFTCSSVVPSVFSEDGQSESERIMLELINVTFLKITAAPQTAQMPEQMALKFMCALMLDPVPRPSPSASHQFAVTFLGRCMT